MRRLSSLGDAALLDRIERLERVEHDLRQSEMAPASHAASDSVSPGRGPRYGYLSSLLKKVHDELVDTENEFLSRGTLGLARIS